MAIRHPLSQHGQALAEALIVLAVLGSLWAGIAWLGRLQDVGLQLAHASRHAAFAHAHQGLVPTALPAIAGIYLDAPGHRWNTRQGHAFLADAGTVEVTSAGPQGGLQPGVPVAGAAGLRGELLLGDSTVWRLVARAQTTGDQIPQGGLADFDRLPLRLVRQTAILRGTGAAAGDADVQTILAGSARAWGDAAASSHAAGDTILDRAGGVDAAWGRPLPDWNWISPWTGSVPRPHLQPWRQP